MNVNFIIYVIIFLLPLKVFAECNFNSSNYINELNNPKNINRIDILIPKAENYIKNFVRIKIATLEEEINPKKLKKNFFAKIKIIQIAATNTLEKNNNIGVPYMHSKKVTKEKKINKLNELEKSDQKSFWKGLNR